MPFVFVSDPPNQLRLLILAVANENLEPLLAYVSKADVAPHWAHVSHATGLRSALRKQNWDMMIVMPGNHELSTAHALKISRELDFDLPLITLVAAGDEKSVIRAMQQGAHDALQLDKLEHLLPAIEREVEEARHRTDHSAALEMLRDSESRFRALASNLPGMVFQLRREFDGELRFLYVSEGCHKLFGLKQHELLASTQRFFDSIEQADRQELQSALADSAGNMRLLNWEGRIKGRGKAKWINLRSTPQGLDEGIVEWQGIVTNISHSKEIEAELRGSREQLSELSFHLEAAKEEERERIARDIHDELGSILVRLKIEAALLAGKMPEASPHLRERASSIEGLLDQAMGTASRVARQLRPGILKEFGLAAAIECQAEDFAHSTGITCRAQCDEDELELEPDVTLALFRIVQEALTNVAKHAHASLVAVRLKHERSSITLEIRDNGRGISETDLNKQKSFGLRGIRERVHSLAGSFSIGAGEHGGTHLQLRVPIRRGSEPVIPEEEPQGNLF